MTSDYYFHINDISISFYRIAKTKFIKQYEERFDVMKKKITLLFILLIAVLLFCMCGVNNDKSLKKEKLSSYDETINLHTLNYNEESKIYDEDYQKNLYNQINNLKKAQEFTLTDPLVIINPFQTNTLGIYVYFETENKSHVEYSIHVDDEISDFINILNNGEKNNLTKKHEYVLIGGVAGKENTVTLNLYDENSELFATKNFKVTLPELDPGSDYILKKETGPSNEALSDGLFATLGHINNENSNSNTYYYDNDGVCRAQIKLDDYRVDRIVIDNGLMYMSVDKSKIAAVNRLGYVEKVYDLGKYEMHHDYILDSKGNLIILVSDTEKDSVEDIVITLNLKDKKIKQIIDLGDLLPSIKEKAVFTEGKEKLDWVHVNSLSLVNDTTLC